MRFPGLDADPLRLGAAPIDFRCFVAMLGAVQTVGATARAAAAAHRSRSPAQARVTPALLRALDGASPPRPAGAFHGAARVPVQGSASKLKEAFTLAFQPSFKAPGL